MEQIWEGVSGDVLDGNFWEEIETKKILKSCRISAKDVHRALIFPNRVGGNLSNMVF